MERPFQNFHRLERRQIKCGAAAGRQRDNTKATRHQQQNQPFEKGG